MAGEAELTGLAKHFNSVTHTGRANVAKVSANTLGGQIQIFRISMSKSITDPVSYGSNRILDPVFF